MQTFYNKFVKFLDVKKENEKIVNISYFSFILSGMITSSMGLVVPFLMIEFNLTYEETSIFLTAHQFGNIFAIIIAGFIPYLIGKKKSIVWLCSAMFGGFLMISLIENPFIIVVGFILVGIGKGIVTNFSNASIVQYSGNKSSAVNVLHAVASTGALLSPFLFLLSDSINMKFRFATLFLSIFTVIIIILYKNSKLTDTPLERTGKGSLNFLKTHWFWIDSLILCFYIAVESSAINWFVIYFLDTGMLTQTIAGFISSLMWATMVVGRLICAKFLGKVSPTKLILTLSISLLVSFTLIILSNSVSMIIITVLLAGLSMSGIYPTTFSTMRGAENNVLTGVALAIGSFGGIFMPYIIGIVADKYDIKTGLFCVVFAIIILVILATVKLVLTNKENRYAI